LEDICTDKEAMAEIKKKYQSGIRLVGKDAAANNKQDDEDSVFMRSFPTPLPFRARIKSSELPDWVKIARARIKTALIVCSVLGLAIALTVEFNIPALRNLQRSRSAPKFSTLSIQTDEPLTVRVDQRNTLKIYRSSALAIVSGTHKVAIETGSERRFEKILDFPPGTIRTLVIRRNLDQMTVE
jgi:hypothetical protein